MNRLFYLLVLLLFHLAKVSLYAQAVPVEVLNNGNGTYTLLRNGEPYYIKGAGGETLALQQELVNRGGNSIRTWGVGTHSKSTLDSADAKGLTVMVGLWVGREKDGFNYNDPVAIANQLSNFRNWVRTYKDHPALLAWGIGNEVDMEYTNLNVWNAINDIALMIKEEDGKHPTLTVTAGISTTKANAIAERAPALDMLGVNSYGGLGSVHSTLNASNFTKPYIITEWGVNGPWEVSKTSWGAPLEANSTSKTATFKSRYETNIAPYTGKCLGSYAFLWGAKFEATQTWFGLFVKNKPAEMTDALQYVWTGNWPANRAPSISGLTINQIPQENNLILPFSNKNEVLVHTTDPDGDFLTIEFLILPESGSQGVEPIPGASFNAIPGIVTAQEGNKAKLNFTELHNNKNLRLYAIIKDPEGHTATASFPFQTAFIDLSFQEWSFPAFQDAYVRDGIFVNTPYGVNDEKKLNVMKSSMSNDNREIYLQFDLKDAPRYFGRARIELSGSAPTNTRIQTFGLNTAWNEQTITWTNKPQISTGNLATTEVTGTSQYYYWDVSGYVQGQFNSGKRVLSFILKAMDETSGNPATFASSESAYGSSRMYFSTWFTQIEDEIHISDACIFPNPTKGIFTLSLPEEYRSDGQIKIWNAQGCMIRHQTIKPGETETQIDLHEFSPGVYQLVLTKPNMQKPLVLRVLKI